MINIALCSPVPVLYNAGGAEDNGMGGNVDVYVAVWGYEDVITDGVCSIGDSVSHFGGIWKIIR